MRLAQIAALLLCATTCWPSTIVVSLTLSNINGASTWNGVYGYPYTISVGTNPAMAMLCDDYADHISVGEQWQADAWALTSGNVGNFLFASNLGGAALQTYDEAAYILTGIAGGAIDAGLGNAAIWSLFDPDLAVGSNVTNIVHNAALNVTPSSNYSNITVYTPDPKTPSPDRPQEFLAINGPMSDSHAPEPPPSLLLAVGGAVLAALGAIRRKRAASS